MILRVEICPVSLFRGGGRLFHREPFAGHSAHNGLTFAGGKPDVSRGLDVLRCRSDRGREDNVFVRGRLDAYRRTFLQFLQFASALGGRHGAIQSLGELGGRNGSRNCKSTGLMMWAVIYGHSCVGCHCEDSGKRGPNKSANFCSVTGAKVQPAPTRNRQAGNSDRDMRSVSHPDPETVRGYRYPAACKSNSSAYLPPSATSC